MNLIQEDLARGHARRWRGNRAAPGGRLSREADRALAARLELARLLYGGFNR